MFIRVDGFTEETGPEFGSIVLEAETLPSALHYIRYKLNKHGRVGSILRVSSITADAEFAPDFDQIERVVVKPYLYH